MPPSNSSFLPMVGNETNGYFEAFLGWCLERIFLGHVLGEIVPCRFCRGMDGDGHLLWDCPYPPLVAVRESPEFSRLIYWDKTEWPWCLLWHGWPPSSSGNMIGYPLAVNPADGIFRQLESYLGPHCPDMMDEWAMDDEFDAEEMAEQMPPSPNTWSVGGRIQDPVSEIEAAGLL